MGVLQLSLYKMAHTSDSFGSDEDYDINYKYDMQQMQSQGLFVLIPPRANFSLDKWIEILLILSGGG